MSANIQIILNDKQITIKKDITVVDLIKMQKLNPNNIAVEINGELCPRSKHFTTIIQNQMQIEFIGFVGGG